MRQSKRAAAVLAALAFVAAAGCAKSYEVTIKDPWLVSMEMNGKALPEEGKDSAVLEDYLSGYEKEAFRDLVALGAGPMPHVLERKKSGALTIATGYDLGESHGRNTYTVDLLDSDGEMVVKDIPKGWKNSSELRIPRIISEIGYAGGMRIDLSYETLIVTRLDNVERIIRRTDTSDTAYGFGGMLYVGGFWTAIAGICVLARTESKDAGWGLLGGGLGSVALGIVLSIITWKVPGFSKFERIIYRKEPGI